LGCVVVGFAIADGTKTVEKVRAGTAQRMKRLF